MVLGEFLLMSRLQIGDLVVSEMGIGTWSWGNQLLVSAASMFGAFLVILAQWGYNEEMDSELQQVFNLCVR